MEKKRVLITGASGFLGQHVVEQMRQSDFEIHALSFKRTAAAKNGVQWHQQDLLRVSEIRPLLDRLKPTHLLHLAWDVGHLDYWNATSNTKWYESTIALANEFQKIGGKRAVFAGSSAEYSWQDGHCKEGTTPETPTTLYGKQKKASCDFAVDLGKRTGLEVAWVRLFSGYGPAEAAHRLVPSVIQCLLRNEPAVCRNANFLRDYLYIEDVARGLCELLESEFRGVINLASGQPVSLGELVLQIGFLMGRSHLVANSESQSQDISVLADTSLLQRVIKFKARASLEEGLTRTIAWWKASIG